MKAEKFEQILAKDPVIGEQIRKHLKVIHTTQDGKGDYGVDFPNVKYIAFRPFESLNFDDGDYELEECVQIVRTGIRPQSLPLSKSRWTRVSHHYYFSRKKGELGAEYMWGFKEESIQEAFAKIAYLKRSLDNVSKIWPSHVIRTTVSRWGPDEKGFLQYVEHMVDVYRFPQNYGAIIHIPEEKVA